ncbi:MAG: exodeoxyribonuclease VII large subunit [Bacteroidales bacterium]|nr:exodeoxyribonuclease VII large subunit [Candidatus Cacconaster merdequi]
MDSVEHISLLELQEAIGETLETGFPDSIWVRAEISELKQNASGHCYMTLVEKEQDSGRLLAKMQSIIWAQQFRLIAPFFESATGSRLASGMAVLLKVRVQYSELYGLSLVVTDIDPSFTIGELELERRRTVERLRAEGMFEMNSSLELPLLPRRFAVVTSATAAGYRDFLKHLSGNEYGYEFRTELFPAVMQGTESPSSVIAALDVIAQRAEDFDAVLILRGGGGAMDLVCFDDYEMAVNVAQFPLPVLSAIGHDHDFHVVDMVAHTSVKTPTALADLIIGIFCEEESRIDFMARGLQLALRGKFEKELSVLDRMVYRLSSSLERRFSDQMRRIELLESKVVSSDPRAVLSKGYAIALKDGRRVECAAKVSRGDRLMIMFEDDTVEVEVL